MEQEILAALKHIKEHGPKDEHVGICYNCAFTREQRQYLYSIAEKWEKHSGRRVFPVAVSKDPEKDYFTSKNHWSRRSKYGKLRWELLGFLIMEIEKDLKRENP